MSFSGLADYLSSLLKTRLLGTGLLDPVNDAIVTVNGGDSSLFDLSSGVAQFSDSFTNMDNPTSVEVSFNSFSAQTLTNLATNSVTFLYLNGAGSLIQSTTLKTGEDLRDFVGLAIIEHSDNTIINNISGFTPVSLNNPIMSLADLSGAMGAINAASGGQNVISGNSGTLSLDKAQGEWYYHSINSRNSNKIQNIIQSGALVAPSMLIGWTVTDASAGKFVNSTTITAGLYDDGTAVQADALPQGTMTNNQWLNMRVFYVVDSHQLAVQYGQVLYGSSAAAVNAVPTEVFTVIPALAGTTPIATITMRGAATDLSDSGDASIRQAIPPRAVFQ